MGSQRMFCETGIIKHQRATAMAAQYDKAVEELKQANRLVINASERLSLEFGGSCGYDNGASCDIERTLKDIKQSAWRYILKQSQITSFLSMKRQKELDKQIEDNKLPDITEKNIVSTLQSFLCDSGAFLNETVKEVFDWLIPYWRDDYKTNKKYQVGKKIIKDWMVDNSWGCGFRVRYGSEEQLTALDNAFNLLDGKGIRRHPENLVCAVNTAMKTEQHYEDHLYKIKWYNKGTMHFEFKRLDLLKKLNQIGADNAYNIGNREYQNKEEGLTVF